MDLRPTRAYIIGFIEHRGQEGVDAAFPKWKCTPEEALRRLELIDDDWKFIGDPKVETWAVKS
jgi:hypothetical protein